MVVGIVARFGGSLWDQYPRRMIASGARKTEGVRSMARRSLIGRGRSSPRLARSGTARRRFPSPSPPEVRTGKPLSLFVDPSLSLRFSIHASLSLPLFLSFLFSHPGSHSPSPFIVSASRLCPSTLDDAAGGSARQPTSQHRKKYRKKRRSPRRL